MNGLKRKDIENCAICDEGLMKSGHPMAYRIKVDTLFADINAINREAGLEQMLQGNVALATVFSPNQYLYTQISESTILCCMDCYMNKLIDLWGPIENKAKLVGD